MIGRLIKSFISEDDGINKKEVARLTKLTEDLTINSALVAKKYEELKTTECKLSSVIEKFEKEDFTNEIKEIQSLNSLDVKEKESFSNSFNNIREATIAELKPVSHSIQRVRAHMLVTLHKAMHKKVVLTIKTSIVQNASLQLDTLKIIDQETKDINEELAKLLQELELINNDAINKYEGFNDKLGSLTSGQNIVEHILKNYNKNE